MEAWEGGIRELDKGIYAYIDPEGTWFKNNSGIIEGEDYSVMIDTQYNEHRIKYILGELEEMNIKNIRLIINTHHHGDHTWTNHLIEDALSLAHKKAKDLIEGMSSLDPSTYKALFPDLDFTGARYTIPNISFEGEHAELRIPGGPRMIVYYKGPAHTIGDVMVYIPDHKILFSGDIVFYKVTPLALDGYITGWIERLEEILDMDVDLIVPGHGPPTNKNGVREIINYLKLIMKEAEKFQNLEDPLLIALRINLGEYSEWRDPERIVPNVERALMEIKGEKPAKPLPDPMSTFMKMIKYKELTQQ